MRKVWLTLCLPNIVDRKQIQTYSWSVETCRVGVTTNNVGNKCTLNCCAKILFDGCGRMVAISSNHGRKTWNLWPNPKFLQQQLVPETILSGRYAPELHIPEPPAFQRSNVNEYGWQKKWNLLCPISWNHLVCSLHNNREQPAWNDWNPDYCLRPNIIALTSVCSFKSKQLWPKKIFNSFKIQRKKGPHKRKLWFLSSPSRQISRNIKIRCTLF